MSAADFLDTNVLVYLVDRRNPAKQAVAQQLVATALAERSGIISFQVVQETLQALTRKARQVLPAGASDGARGPTATKVRRDQPAAGRRLL